MQTPTGTLILLGAALLAGPALAQSATISQSGATVAAERTAPRAGNTAGSAGDEALASDGRKKDYDWDEPVEPRTGDTAGSQSAPRGEAGAAGGGGVRDRSRVRAPAFTYSNDSSNRDHIDQDAQVTRRDTSAQGSDGGSDDQPIFDRWGRQEEPLDANGRPAGGPTRGEAQTDEATPVNGIGGTGGGRYTFKPATRSGATDSTDGGPQTGEPDLRSTSTASGFAPVRPAEFLARDQEARGSDNEPRPGILRVINNSETDAATVEGGVSVRPVTLSPVRPR